MKTLLAVCVILSLGLVGCGEKSSGDGTKKDGAEKGSSDAKKDGKSKPGDSAAMDGKKSQPKRDEPKPDEAAEKKATPLQVLDYDEIQKLIASHKGKVVVLDAWAMYCQPCLRDFNNLVEIHEKYDTDKVACVSLSFDFGGDAKLDELKPKVQTFLDKQGATFDNIISNEPWETLYTKFDFEAVPTVFVYGTDGKLIKRVEEDYENEDAPKIYEQVRTLVEKLISERKS